jgi:hypothetical protein
MGLVNNDIDNVTVQAFGVPLRDLASVNEFKSVPLSQPGANAALYIQYHWEGGSIEYGSYFVLYDGETFIWARCAAARHPDEGHVGTWENDSVPPVRRCYPEDHMALLILKIKEHYGTFFHTSL